MVNVNELNEKVNEWLCGAGEDVSNIIQEMMSQEDMTEMDIAEYLDVEVEDVMDALDGDVADMPLVLFAAILIAGGNVISVGKAGRMIDAQQPQVCEQRTNKLPQRDARGRFVRQTPNPTVAETPQREFVAPEQCRVWDGQPNTQRRMPQGMQCQRLDLDRMSRQELSDLICHVGAAGQIDLTSATRSQMIAFLNEMGDNRHMFDRTVNQMGEVDTNQGRRASRRSCGCENQNTCHRSHNTQTTETPQQRSTRERLEDMVSLIQENPSALQRLFDVLGV